MPHGVAEGQAEDLVMEVNGVAGQIALGSAPVAVLDDGAGIGGQGKIARFAFDQFQVALLEQRYEGASRAPQLKAH